jgi:hypothetical protein
MAKRRKQGTYTILKKFQWKIWWEMKKISPQFLTPIKQ